MIGVKSSIIRVLVRHYKHKKRGTEYRLMTQVAKVQSNAPIYEGDLVAVYMDSSGDYWIRPDTEFMDGRFEGVPE